MASEKVTTFQSTIDGKDIRKKGYNLLKEIRKTMSFRKEIRNRESYKRDSLSYTCKLRLKLANHSLFLLWRFSLWT
jgi:hypothetical protein